MENNIEGEVKVVHTLHFGSVLNHQLSNCNCVIKKFRALFIIFVTAKRKSVQTTPRLGLPINGLMCHYHRFYGKLWISYSLGQYLATLEKKILTNLEGFADVVKDNSPLVELCA
jgi:hypothetical protein